ncbi:hypothetical protein KAW50_06645 [candidate division WOR-3 bacterium]|nr:hypothetical protein [candidate division WOR-3 bacterium]
MLLLVVTTCNAVAIVPREENPDLSIDEIRKVYATIRNMSLDSSKVIQVDSCLLQKDAGNFIFESGYLYFFEPVLGKSVSAFFQGKGVFRLSTENEIERQQLQRFTGRDTVEQNFEQALFVFSDSTYEQIIAQQKPLRQSINDGHFKKAMEFRKRIRKRFIWNVDARVLSDLVIDKYGYFFQAYIECPKSRHLLFIVDNLLHKVSLIRYKKIRHSERATVEIWYSVQDKDSFPRYKRQFDIKTTNIDISIDTKEILKATTQLQFISFVDGMRIVPMNLSPKLRVETVINDARDTCFFIQEEEKEDATLWVVFPTPPRKDSISELTLIYSGKEIVEDVGGGNFVVSRRTSWYPSFYANRDPTRFIMKFAVPEEMTLLTTGKLLRSWNEGKVAYSEWDSEIDHIFAGFNYGQFSTATQKSSLCDISCYTNVYLSDALFGLRRLLETSDALQEVMMMLPQELNTEGIGKNAAIESRNAYEVCVHFFGEIPFRKIKVSQQPQGAFGQSWPTLVYLSYTAFLSESLKDKLGLIQGDESAMWYETVAAHEIAHQWWGHTVITDSYHDEWLDEGFATYSAALYLQTTEGTNRFKDYMKILQKQILEKIEKGKRATEIGPIWLGRRLNSLETSRGYRLIYSKGAYVLHMLRMMLFDYERKSDARFISMMKDYVNIYSGKIVSIKDFKKITEKHFGENMDWFFNQWVYGIEIPVYRFKYEVEHTDDGKYFLTVTVVQEGVSPSFKMPFHMVINFANGHTVGHMLITGAEPIKKQFIFRDKPKSVEPNPWHGVLCELKQ